MFVLNDSMKIGCSINVNAFSRLFIPGKFFLGKRGWWIVVSVIMPRARAKGYNSLDEIKAAAKI